MQQSVSHPELTQWLESRERSLKITTTTTTQHGRTVDWVPIESQSSEKISEPPPAVEMEYGLDPKRRTQPVSFDTGPAGPPGHVPILRPTLAKVPHGMTLERYLSKKGGLLVNVNRANKKPTDPNPAGYFHATSSSTINSYGCDAWLNVWDPSVDVPSSPGDDHSISQTWLQNYQTPSVQSIEAGLTVDHSLNGDSANHLFTYYTTNGYSQDGVNIGGYNRLDGGWVQYNATIFPGIRINGSSTQGSQSQLEIGIKFQLYEGNWWFGFSNNESGPWTWLGYYPASLFPNGLGNLAQWVSFGGEVYTAMANPCATLDQMGSGRQAAEAYSHAAFQRLMHVQTSSSGTVANFNGIPEVDAAASTCTSDPYTITTFMNSGTSWGSYQYFGGPAR